MSASNKESNKGVQGTQTQELTPNLQPESAHSLEKQPVVISESADSHAKMLVIGQKRARSECLVFLRNFSIDFKETIIRESQSKSQCSNSKKKKCENSEKNTGMKEITENQPIKYFVVINSNCIINKMYRKRYEELKSIPVLPNKTKDREVVGGLLLPEFDSAKGNLLFFYFL